MVTTGAQTAAASQVHPHPIRWDPEQELWVCSRGCGFTRPRRESEVVPTREEAREEARRAGTGGDFADLKPAPPAAGEPPAGDQPAEPPAGQA
jgi:hypothetical protein